MCEWMLGAGFKSQLSPAHTVQPAERFSICRHLKVWAVSSQAVKEEKARITVLAGAI